MKILKFLNLETKEEWDVKLRRKMGGTSVILRGLIPGVFGFSVAIIGSWEAGIVIDCKWMFIWILLAAIFSVITIYILLRIENLEEAKKIE